ncbi:MAG: sugar phosphate isomerase/epimerase family protein [Bacillota bacterium]|nr:sugar phosphate isomerase/epimerase family protein [Bacillota bacterium]
MCKNGANSIGLSNGLFGLREPAEDDFRQLKENGIRQIELRLKPGYFDIHEKQLISRVSHWLDRYGIEVSSVHGPSGYPGNSPVTGIDGETFWLAHPDDGIRHDAVVLRRETLDVCRHFDAKSMIVEYECYGYAPYWPHGSPIRKRYPDVKKHWQQSIEMLLEDADRTGVKLAIENIDGLSISEMSHQVDKWPEHLIGCCLDSSHATYDCTARDLNCTAVLPRLITTHLSDNDGLCGAGWIDRHWVPFSGVIDWESLIGRICRSGYSGCFMLEVLNPEKRITDQLMAAIEKLGALIDKCRSQISPVPEKKIQYDAHHKKASHRPSGQI